MVRVPVFVSLLLVLHSSADFQTYAQLTVLLAQGLQNLEAELMTDYSPRDTGKPAIFQKLFS